MDVINEKECPECHGENTNIIDMTYNCETRKCQDCGTKYDVKFKSVAVSIRVIPDIYKKK